ncbi:MAG TPA: hypothetical protein VFT44_02815, partial [Pyrinomonadaceae bacterium]|nr:hypothetical protein [Pyrinomonadaceae bacterium]
MNRLIALRLIVSSLFLCTCLAATTLAQTASPSPSPSPSPSNPFAPEPAPTLPAGMTGSDANDPRSKLKPGFNDAGEAALGLKHLMLVPKPNAFQLPVSDPNDPKVKEVLSRFGAPMSEVEKLPKPVQLVTAQLAFANSDIAFQGNHLFLGNFYGMSIYDISNPAKPKLLTTMVCPGG